MLPLNWFALYDKHLNLFQFKCNVIILTKHQRNFLFPEFDGIFNKLESNIKENQTLTQLRDTLLPQLISGAVRLKEFQEKTENIM
jgi:hypothetical protein